MADAKQMNIGGSIILLKDEEARQQAEYLRLQTNHIFDGRNLADVYNAEIAHYTDAWEWIKDRLDLGVLSDLMVCDFIDFKTTGGETVREQIAGINTYKRTLDTELGDHIDFISKDCLVQTVQWNTTNNNNGNAEDAAPYMVSNVRDFLLNTVLPTIPENVKKHISTKRTLIETRYSESGVLTDSNSWAWKDLGLLWTPTEFEVNGTVIWGTKGYSAGQAMQYPYFANSYKNRIKGAGHNGSRCNWWVASVDSGYSAYACNVDGNGSASSWNASNASRVPVCFRFKKSSNQ